IRAGGHPDALVHGETTHAGEALEGLEFVLDDGASIRGRVTGAGEHARELWIHAVPKNLERAGKLFAGERVDEERFLVLPRSAHCADDGNFVVSGLTRDVTYRIAARAGEHDAFGEERSDALELLAGAENVELPYRPPTELAFQVVDAQT